ncbi:TRAP transporter small permease subunit [Gimibacter soli]|uniref:TRAP transporter small permease protein n=1 Tax=Gimibacter soli TaxID=3024400 RepID=A0AAF0BJG1_9PROT|nr:TRAP transporter small permease subunit [Gimibacter soli]WCL53084.1 TRAP transporter small permease subunit [Gimibacter soli]
MGWLERLAGKLERIVAFFGRSAAWLLLLLMAVIVADVTLRHWFVIGSTKLQELEWHLHGGLFLLTMAWAYSRNSHVRIELVSERLSERARAIIELAGIALLLIPYVAAILWFGSDYLAYSFAFNEGSASATGLPWRWIIKGILVFGFALLGLAAIARACRAVLTLRAGGAG